MSDKLVERDGVIGVVLDPEEEAELVEQIADLPDAERRGELRPVEDTIAELRAELRQRRAG
jgi:uncharacterized coiled-coil DUF342 family protein